MCFQLCQVLDPLLFEHLGDVFTDHLRPELQHLCFLSHYYESVELFVILTKIVIGQLCENFLEDLRFLPLENLLDLLCNYGGKGALVSFLVLHLLNYRYLEQIHVSLLLAKLQFNAVDSISEHLQAIVSIIRREPGPEELILPCHLAKLITETSKKSLLGLLIFRVVIEELHQMCNIVILGLLQENAELVNVHGDLEFCLSCHLEGVCHLFKLHRKLNRLQKILLPIFLDKVMISTEK